MHMSSAPRLRPTSPRSKGTLWLLWLLLGPFGAHRFYLGQMTHGMVLILLTLGTCGVGGVLAWIDGLVVLLSRTKDAHGLPVTGLFHPATIIANDVEDAALLPGDAIAQILVHTLVMFALPFVVGGTAGIFLETSEVKDTAMLLAGLSGLVLLPILCVHALGVVCKTREEARLLREAGVLSTRTLLDAAARSAAVLTPRGFLVLGTGLMFIVLSLGYEWASLGVLAVLSLTAFYVVTGATAVLSAFLVRRFSSDVFGAGGALTRRITPGVVRAGDAATDVIELSGVPVPPGFFLLLEGAWPARLKTRVRHVVPPRARDQRVTLETPLERTPRGSHVAQPLRVAFTDLLGLTKTSVASLATARVKVLPSLRPTEIVSAPPSDIEEPDVVSRPHRFPTEDYFRLREYVPGDDTRRIHWKLSMKAGRLVVKKPDSKESTSKRVLLALDTHVPHSWAHHTAVLDDALDALVESWLGVAQRLVEDGQRVTLLVRARSEDGAFHDDVLSLNRSNHALALDAGARAEWQTDAPIEAVLEAAAQEHQLEGTFDTAVIVSMRLEAPPARVLGARDLTWIYLHPRDALGAEPPSALDTWLHFDGERKGLRILERLLLLPHPAGSDDNSVGERLRDLERRLQDRAHRVELRREVQRAGDAAIGALLHGESAVYRVELTDGGGRRLRGLKGQSRKRRLASAAAQPVDAVDARRSA